MALKHFRVVCVFRGSKRLRRDVAAELRAVFRPGRDNWKLASHNVAGLPGKIKIRPERTAENICAIYRRSATKIHFQSQTSHFVAG